MPEFKQQLTMHLNGGSKYSELHYSVTADGEPTEVTRHKRTDGRPKYLVTDDLFHCRACGADFDVLAARGVGVVAWLEAHAGPHAAKEAADAGAELG